ncbi:MAG: hypothetical protein V4621_02525 [Pseudomonadota bacterium]
MSLPPSLLPPVIVRLTGPHLTPDAVERFSLLIPGRILNVEWGTPDQMKVELTCPDGLPVDIIPAMTELAQAREWHLSVVPHVLSHGQKAEIL